MQTAFTKNKSYFLRNVFNQQLVVHSMSWNESNRTAMSQPNQHQQESCLRKYKYEMQMHVSQSVANC